MSTPSTRPLQVGLMLPIVADLLDGRTTRWPDPLAARRRAYASAGVSHVQVIRAPRTLAGIEASTPVLQRLADAGGAAASRAGRR